MREAEAAQAPAPFDYWAEIDRRVAAAVAAEREFQHDLLAHTLAYLRDEQAEAIDARLKARANDDVTTLTAALKQVTETLARVQIVLADASKSGGTIIDLPPLPRRTGDLN